MKKFIPLIVAILVSFLLLPTFAGADQKINVDQLKNEFESQLLEQIDNSTGYEKERLQNEYNKYSSLTKDKQEKLVMYLNDEELMSKVMEEFNKDSYIESSESMKNINGETIKTTEIFEDIAIVESLQDSPTIDSDGIELASDTRTATFRRTVTVFGVRAFEHASSVTYVRVGGEGGTITDLLGSDHRITRNLTVNQLEYSGLVEQFSSTYAQSTSNFTVAIIWKGVWTYDDGECRVRVDNSSNVTGYFKSNNP